MDQLVLDINIQKPVAAINNQQIYQQVPIDQNEVAN